jgi:hypothetical protein
MQNNIYSLLITVSNERLYSMSVKTNSDVNLQLNKMIFHPYLHHLVYIKTKMQWH